MNVTTISDLRKNTKKYFDRVVADQDVLVVSRGQGKSVVVMTMEQYNNMDATDYLNSSKVNREHLERGMANVKAGKTFVKTMEELRQYE